MVPDINGKPIGMNWYKFLIYFSFFASALLNAVNSINYFTGSMYYNGFFSADDIYSIYGNELRNIDILFGMFLISLSIMALVLRYKLANYKPDSLRLLYLFYFLSFGGNFVYLSLVATIVSAPIGASEIAPLISGLIFLLLNFRYFNRRKHLFIGVPPSEIMISPSSSEEASDTIKDQTQVLSVQSDENNSGVIHVCIAHTHTDNAPSKILFCRKCGTKLMDNSSFCHKCGTSISA